MLTRSADMLSVGGDSARSAVAADRVADPGVIACDAVAVAPVASVTVTMLLVAEQVVLAALLTVKRPPGRATVTAAPGAACVVPSPRIRVLPDASDMA